MSEQYDDNTPNIDKGTGFKKHSVSLDWAFNRQATPAGPQMTQAQARRLGWRTGYGASRRSLMDELRPRLGSLELRQAWEKGFREGYRAKP